MDLEKKTEFQKIIFENYRQNPRNFPWRHTTDPYEILVSEIMLQQTQTERVVPKYNQWLSVFPGVENLAAAPLSLVLQNWVGLGYNRRARFLQAACQKIHKELDGVFPSDAESLDALPGVGPYTARAVAAFAFGKPEVFIETNIRSVFIFFFFPDSETVDDRDILPLVAESLYLPDPKNWYYALMDYGAALKKRVQNPNRKSAHYTRQSKFAGSLRQARGAVLRQLARFPEGVSLTQVAEIEKVDYEKINVAAENLCAEGFIYSNNDLYRIC